MGEKEPNNHKKQKVVIDQQCCFFDDLIIEKILTRLPIKSILRFKSVSKQWYSTLSSSYFANAHLTKSPFSRPFAPVDTLFIKSGNNFYLSSCDDDQLSGNNFEVNQVKLDVDFHTDDNDFQLTGCCNGLICLTSSHDDHFIIWNPTISKMHKYEYPEGDDFNRANFSDWSIVFRGFGYVSSVDDYKYVRILNMCYSKGKISIVHIFSLKEKKWKKIDFNHEYQDRFILGERGVQVNEKLYMTARVGIGIKDTVIVSFDLVLETFEITLFHIGLLDIFGLMGGFLSIIKFCSHNKSIHIQISPILIKSMRLPARLMLDMHTEMIGFTRSAKFFLTTRVIEHGFLVSRNRQLWLFDIRTKPMGYSMLMEADDGLNIARYVPSLVSPFPN